MSKLAKIFLFLYSIFFITIWFYIFNISETKADYLDLYWTWKISNVVLQKWVTNTYTIYNTWWYLYIKDITVTAINNTWSWRLYLAFCSSSPVYWELQFCKTFTKLSFNYFDNYNFSFNTLLPNSFEVKMENFPTTYTGLVKIDVNYLSFNSKPQLNNSSSWTLSTQNIENSLNFQNDLLIFIFWFIIMFFSLVLSFWIYSFLTKNYFFNKKQIWKK